MKNLNSPGYTKRREYTPCHAAPNGGRCPVCGQFAAVYGGTVSEEFRRQYRACQCGHRFSTTIRRPQ